MISYRLTSCSAVNVLAVEVAASQRHDYGRMNADMAVAVVAIDRVPHFVGWSASGDVRRDEVLSVVVLVVCKLKLAAIGAGNSDFCCVADLGLGLPDPQSHLLRRH